MNFRPGNKAELNVGDETVFIENVDNANVDNSQEKRL